MPLKTHHPMVSSPIFSHFNNGCLLYGGLSGRFEIRLKRLMNFFIFILRISPGGPMFQLIWSIKVDLSYFLTEILSCCQLFLILRTKKPPNLLYLFTPLSSNNSLSTRSQSMNLSSCQTCLPIELLLSKIP